MNVFGGLAISQELKSEELPLISTTSISTARDDIWQPFWRLVYCLVLSPQLLPTHLHEFFRMASILGILRLSFEVSKNRLLVAKWWNNIQSRSVQSAVNCVKKLMATVSFNTYVMLCWHKSSVYVITGTTRDCVTINFNVQNQLTRSRQFLMHANPVYFYEKHLLNITSMYANVL